MSDNPEKVSEGKLGKDPRAEGLNTNLHETERRWFAVYTKHKHEMQVEKRLLAKGIEVYVPTMEHVTRNSKGALRRRNVPLIQGYAFVHIVKDDYPHVLADESVVNVVRIGRRLIPIPEAEIRAMRLITSAKLDEVKVGARGSEPIASGRPVRISSGPLFGLTGRFKSPRGKRTVVVELEQAGFVLEMELPLEVIEIIK